MQSTVIDVGANVGNHTIFYAMHTWAGLVYPFEPNIEARRLLLSSLSGNFDYRARVSTEYVEYAVGNKAERLKITATSENNLGGTSFGATSEDSQDIVDCIRLDDIDFDGHISFLKIDVEGMELQVLGGAINLIGRFRPAIALEISARHEPEFWKWLSDNDYQVVNVFFEYLHFKNYLLIPKNKKYL